MDLFIWLAIGIVLFLVIVIALEDNTPPRR